MRCIFQHQKREGNFCADKLAEMGVNGSEDVQNFENPLKQLVSYLVADY